MKVANVSTVAATLLFTPLFASAMAQESGHRGSMAPQTSSGDTAKSEEVRCPMMQGMHGGMKMDGTMIPQGHGGSQHEASGGHAGGEIAGMKCMHHGDGSSTGTALAPEGEHDHDHRGAR